MIHDAVASRHAVVEFCARIGVDPLLTQGAGGNVSWKHGNAMWIKASGTWLAHATEKDIFVPVDLDKMRASISVGDFEASPVSLGDSTLRPSIETSLHALMPHRIVVHLHAIEALAHLVRVDWLEQLKKKLGHELRWTTVPYRKPGAELAKAVHGALALNAVDIVFLQNHGVVMGADTVAEIDVMLGTLTRMLATPPVSSNVDPALPQLHIGGRVYLAVADRAVQGLALIPSLFARASNAWALYPDHVVFLGAEPPCFDDMGAVSNVGADAVPEFVIVRNVGVFAASTFGIAKQVQLRCYLDVLARQREGEALHTLDMAQIDELLNWDSERYRMGLAKK